LVLPPAAPPPRRRHHPRVVGHRADAACVTGEEGCTLADLLSLEIFREMFFEGYVFFLSLNPFYTAVFFVGSGA